MRRAGAVLAVLAVIGLLVLLAAPGTAEGEAAGEPLAGYGLGARAGGIEISYSDSEGTGGRGSVPEASATLATGPVGNALSSVAWPGPTVADVGTLVAFLAGVDQTRSLNYPVRAEASSPGGPGDAETTVGPTTTMNAHAEADLSHAHARSGGTEIPGMLRAGALASTARTAVHKGVATSQSSSEVQDLVLVGGAVTIQSVQSSARATTDGVATLADARTLFTGVEVGGRPAVIDEHGIRFEDQRTDAAGPAVAQTRDAGLSPAGVEVRVTEPVEVRDASGTTVTAGSAVFTFSQEGHRFSVTLGGATASASAVPDDEAPMADLADEVVADDLIGPVTAAAGGGLDPAAVDLPAGDGSGHPIAPRDRRPAGPLPVAPLPVGLRSYEGLPALTVMGSVAAACLLACGLCRLADHALSPTGPECAFGAEP